MRKKIPFLLLTLLFLCFYAFFYGKVLLEPNAYLFSTEGDGIKNYFTYVSHIKNNSSLSNFEGINYPYGENILYTDGHPLFIALFKPLHAVFPSLANYSIGILNFLMLISLYVGGIFLLKVFKLLKIEAWPASLMTFGILLLAPQIFRFNGHLSLSYACFLPISIYLLLQVYLSGYRKKFIVYLLFNITFWLFVHAYLGAILISLLIAFELVQYAFKEKVALNKRLLILIPILLPILLFYTIRGITDFHSSRSTNPYGFFEYYADFDTVLLPNHPPFKFLVDQLLPSFTQTWEGWAYVGLSSILLAGIYLLIFLKKHPLLKTEAFSNASATFLRKLMLAGFVVLLFSLGFPFRLGLESLLDHFSILKQFRSIGRFAWVFYFSITITAAYFLYFIGASIRSKFLKIGLYLFFPLLMIVESFAYHQEVGFQMRQSPNYFNPSQLSEELTTAFKSIEKDKHQALIPLPFYCIGSENYERDGNSFIYKHSMLSSYHLNLPILGNHLSRSSLQEGKNMMQLLAPIFYNKQIKNDIHSKKPFLIIKEKEALREDEEALISRAKLLHRSNGFEYYEIHFDSLFKSSIQAEVSNFYQLKNNSIEMGQYWSSDSTPFYHEHIGYSAGLKEIDKNGEHSIFEIQSNTLTLNKNYTASIWLYRGGKNFGQDQLNYLSFGVKESLNEKVLQKNEVVVMESSTLFENWTRVELNFQIQKEESSLSFFIRGNDPKDKNLQFQDFFLKQENQLIYWQDKEANLLFKNNHRIKY